MRLSRVCPAGDQFAPGPGRRSGPPNSPDARTKPIPPATAPRSTPSPPSLLTVVGVTPNSRANSGPLTTASSSIFAMGPFVFSRRLSDFKREAYQGVGRPSIASIEPLRTPALFPSVPESLLHKFPDAPCCLVLDVRLPGVNGLDFQTQMANSNIHVPIIMMTGHGDIPMRESMTRTRRSLVTLVH